MVAVKSVACQFELAELKLATVTPNASIPSVALKDAPCAASAASLMTQANVWLGS
jgi:hypothetical protein